MTKKKSSELDKELNKFIANKIIHLRKYYNITQKEIGNKINVSIQQVQKYCVGKNRISAAKLYIIANSFNIPLNAFFPKKENESNVNYNFFYLKQIFDEFSYKQKVEFLVHGLDSLAQIEKIEGN